MRARARVVELGFSDRRAPTACSPLARVPEELRPLIWAFVGRVPDEIQGTPADARALPS